MADFCDVCGIKFDGSNPRYHVGKNVVCKKCKEKLLKFGSVEKVIEAEKIKFEEAQNERKVLEEQQKLEDEKNGVIYKISGARGKNLTVFKDKAIIKTKVTLGSLITQNATDGEKTIYFVDVIGVQFKKSSLTLGYLQLETASGQMNNKGSNFFGENSFVWDPSTSTVTNDEMEEVANYIKKQVEEIKLGKNQPVQNVQVSAADEIMKLKGLLDMGILTQEEFDAKKKQLLGI